jgi:hypothetical protein
VKRILTLSKYTVQQQKLDFLVHAQWFDITEKTEVNLITLDKSGNFSIEFCGRRNEISSYLTKFSLISFQFYVQWFNKTKQNLVVPAVKF